MTAILRRELRASFTSLSGTLVIVFMLLITGIYGTALHFSAGYTAFEYLISNLSFVFLLLVPVLTMRVFAEEGRQRTDTLLCSLPLRSSDVVLGKYFALLGVWGVPCAVLALWPTILSLYGTVALGTAYTAWFGFVLAGCAMLSIGMFLSALTESQLVAALLSFAALLLSYLMPAISSLISAGVGTVLAVFTLLIAALALVTRAFTKSLWLAVTVGLCLEIPLSVVCLLDYTLLTGAVQAIFDALSLFAPLDSFVCGIFDLTGVVYYLSVAFLFNFLTIQALEQRRWR